MRIYIIAAILMIVTVLSACSLIGNQETGIVVQDAWIRAMGIHAMDGESEPEVKAMTGYNSAAYMVIRNESSINDKLLRVEGDVASAIEIHMSEMKEGVMRMYPVEFIEIPSNEMVELKPGGLHIMLIDVKQELQPGDKIPLVLVFEIAGKVPVDADVRVP